MATTARPVRQRDPRRRERIIEAAVAVIGATGLAGLTHRSAAAQAGVPLGSTTYYFAHIDELLDAAVRTVAERNVERLRNWAESLPGQADLSAELADFLVLLATEHRQTSVLAYELYGAALRRTALRAASTAWDTMLTEVFESRVDPITAKALTAMFDGLLYQALVSPGPPRRGDIEPVLRRLLDHNGPIGWAADQRDGVSGHYGQR
jgi:TetR/AcrR family transcriptional regulator, regulator of biofilm formation and stress response